MLMWQLWASLTIGKTSHYGDKHCFQFGLFIESSFRIQTKALPFAVTISTTPLSNAYQGGTFAFYTFMEYTKQPLDYPQILQMLKDRGLIIRNDNEAIEQLKIR